MGNRVGPIIFAHGTARQQLLSGEVVTFRTDRRTTGETHARWERLGGKQADVIVNHLTAIDPNITEDLARYAPLSGFEDVEAWQKPMKTLNNRSELPDGHLYYVTLAPSEVLVRAGGEKRCVKRDMDAPLDAVLDAYVGPLEMTTLSAETYVDALAQTRGRVALHVEGGGDREYWVRYSPVGDFHITYNRFPRGEWDSVISESRPSAVDAVETAIEAGRGGDIDLARPVEAQFWDWEWALEDPEGLRSDEKEGAARL